MRKREVKDSMTAAAGHHVCGSVNVWLDDPLPGSSFCSRSGSFGVALTRNSL